MNKFRLFIALTLLALLTGLFSIPGFPPSPAAAANIGNPGELIISNLQIEPKDPHVEEGIRITFTLYNPTTSQIVVDPVGIGMRGPNACAFDNPWTAQDPNLAPSGQTITIDAGQTYQATFPPIDQYNNPTYTSPFINPGVYIMEPVFMDANGNFKPFGNSTPYWINVRPKWSTMPNPAPPCLIVSKPLTITPSNPSPGQLMTAQFTVYNNSSRTIYLTALKAAGRMGYDWNGTNADFPSPFSSYFLAPGQSYTYSASTYYSGKGTYFAEPWFQEYGTDNWRSGGIYGGNRVYTRVADWVCGSSAPPLYFQGDPHSYSTSSNLLQSPPDWYKRQYGLQGAPYTIGSSGCNLSSAASILSYYGMQNTASPSLIDPERLNAYLQNTPGGYVGDSAVSHDVTTGILGLHSVSLPYSYQAVNNLLCGNTSGISAGTPVILGVNNNGYGHFVLATGVIRVVVNGTEQETLAINDPIYGQTSLLEQYGSNDNATSALYYAPGKKGSLSFYLTGGAASGASLSSLTKQSTTATDSPGELMIIDPQGRRLGYDLFSGAYNEIPDASYSSVAIGTESAPAQPEQKVAYISSPLDGEYQVYVEGNTSGNYQLQTVQSTSSGEMTSNEFTGYINPAQYDSYQVTYHDDTKIFLPVAIKSLIPVTTSDLRGLTVYPTPWAVGTNGVILHYNGTDWVNVPSPTTEDLYGITMLSDKNGWAVGNNGVILHWNGNNWSKVPSPTSSFLLDVSFFAPDNGWAVGEGVILYYNGSSWVQKGTTNTVFRALSTPNTADGWMVGDIGTTARYNGNVWDLIDTPFWNGLYAVSSVSTDDAWAVGDASFGSNTILAHWNGYSWNEWSNDLYVKLRGVKMLGWNDVWAAGDNGVLMHYDGSSWSGQPSPTSNSLYAMDMSSATDGWAVGEGGTILHFDGSHWVRTH